MKSVALAVLLIATAPHAEVKTGDKFVELDAKTAKGKNFRLKDMSGKWVLYTFGASWCGPCSKELPAWDKVATKFAGKVLFVSVNIDDKQADGEAFLNDLKLMPQEGSTAIKSYDPSHMPSTFVIDPDGVVRYIHMGYDKGDEDKLAADLEKLVK